MIVENKYIINDSQVNDAKKLRTQELFEILTEMGGIHSELVGNSREVLLEQRLAWVLLTWKIRFIKRPKLGDEILIKTWVRNSDSIVSLRDFEVYDNSGEKIIIAASKWCLINLDTRRPVRFSETLGDSYQPEDKNAFEEELPKVREPKEYTFEMKYQIKESDIDVNNHVHNSNYLDIAFESIPEFDENKKNFDNVLIEFKKEIMYGEDVQVYHVKENGEDVVTLKVNDKVNAIVVLS